MNARLKDIPNTYCLSIIRGPINQDLVDVTSQYLSNLQLTTETSITLGISNVEKLPQMAEEIRRSLINAPKNTTFVTVYAPARTNSDVQQLIKAFKAGIPENAIHMIDIWTIVPKLYNMNAAVFFMHTQFEAVLTEHLMFMEEWSDERIIH